MKTLADEAIETMRLAAMCIRDGSWGNAFRLLDQAAALVASEWKAKAPDDARKFLFDGVGPVAVGKP